MLSGSTFFFFLPLFLALKHNLFLRFVLYGCLINQPTLINFSVLINTHSTLLITYCSRVVIVESQILNPGCIIAS